MYFLLSPFFLATQYYARILLLLENLIAPPPAIPHSRSAVRRKHMRKTGRIRGQKVSVKSIRVVIELLAADLFPVCASLPLSPPLSLSLSPLFLSLSSP